MHFFSASAAWRAILCTCIWLFTTVAQAAFPDRPITIVVPYAPGGAGDTIARLLATKLGPKLGTSVIVENRPGASGTIGTSQVARAAADGYTLLYAATPHAINPQLFSQLPYAAEDLQPLSLLLLAPNALVVRADSSLQTIQDLIEQAKAKPGKLNFASGGSGTVQRLSFELLRQHLGLDIMHVPYRSGAPAIADVVAGQVEVTYGTIVTTLPMVSSGRLRALAVSSLQRSELMPEVPTVAETVLPGYEAYEWYGVLVPKQTPKEIIATLHAAMVGVLQDNEIQQRLKEMGAQPVGSTPEEFAVFLEKEGSKWADVIRQGNITLE